MSIVRGFVIVAATAIAGCGGGSGAVPPPTYVAPITPSGILAVSQSALTFTSIPASATLSVSESGYGGILHASLSCAVATVSPTSATPGSPGAPVAFTVTAARASGTCTLHVSDSGSHTVDVPITIAVGAISPLHVSTAALTVTTSAGATFTVSEPNYGATSTQFFTATATCSPQNALASYSTSAFPSAAGAAATFAVRGQAPGTCSLLVADQLGQSQEVSITVTRGIAVVPSSAIFIDTTPQTVVLNENGVASFHVVASTCGGEITIAALAGSTSQFSITPTTSALSSGLSCSVTFGDAVGGTGTLPIYVNAVTIGVQ